MGVQKVQKDRKKNKAGHKAAAPPAGTSHLWNLASLRVVRIVGVDWLQLTSKVLCHNLQHAHNKWDRWILVRIGWIPFLSEKKIALALSDRPSSQIFKDYYIARRFRFSEQGMQWILKRKIWKDIVDSVIIWKCKCNFFWSVS